MKTVNFNDINVGDKSSQTKTVTQNDINDFAKVSGDHNPVHLSEEFAKATQFGGIIAHGMLAVSYISTVLGTQYPGAGSIFMGMNNVQFLGPVRPGDTITTTVTVTEKHASKPIVKFACECVNQDGHIVVKADAVVRAPSASPKPKP
ncbi:MAG: MaoC family dehydratase [Alphaproteobacteria bacterium]|nr:MaoC family dehydratase [Alphaproteobacteria bacterium]MBU0859383.1 MaoC family dehydratase [Alphaproteobacteria bacterium]